HCGRLPATLLPGMVRAQFARDALMAQTLLRDASRGAVLLAGNGHVRRDIGVPRWFTGVAPQRVWSVGFLETPDAAASSGLFDAVVLTPPATRDADPCDQVSEPRR
ncbi:MAG TPA: ChaN family lipoprotein, partial [Albitalea sp.]|nr:ChaN family lipoprotein [Albitalea sp.]